MSCGCVSWVSLCRMDVVMQGLLATVFTHFLSRQRGGRWCIEPRSDRCLVMLLLLSHCLGLGCRHNFYRPQVAYFLVFDVVFSFQAI